MRHEMGMVSESRKKGLDVDAGGKDSGGCRDK